MNTKHFCNILFNIDFVVVVVVVRMSHVWFSDHLLFIVDPMSLQRFHTKEQVRDVFYKWCLSHDFVSVSYIANYILHFLYTSDNSPSPQHKNVRQHSLFSNVIKRRFFF